MTIMARARWVPDNAWERFDGRIPDSILYADWSDWWQAVICFLDGHVPDADQCNLPEHDRCIWCGKSMPGQAPWRTPSSQ